MPSNSISDKLPQDFLPLHETELRPDQEVNVIGVIVDFLPPAPTKGSDWLLSLGIQDPSYLSSTNQRSGLRVRFFKKEALLPKVSGIGDVIILRKIKRNFYNGTPMLTSTWNTQATVFPASTIPDETFTPAYVSDHLVIPHVTNPGRLDRPSDEEQLYVIGLSKWAKETVDLSSISVPICPRAQTNHVPMQKTATKPGNKFRLLKDVSENAYYDLVGEVVKIWKSDFYTTVYWTDYTSNKRVQPITTADDHEPDRDGDPYGFTSDIRSRKDWTGPTGQLVLQIFLWRPHSDWANVHLAEHDFVFIKNVRIGVRDGKKYLRADLNEDQKHPDQIDIRKINLNDPRCQEMMARREKYWAERAEKEQPQEKRLSKRQKKELRRKEKLKAEQAAKVGRGSNIFDVLVGDDSNEELPHQEPSRVKAINGNIACTHPDQPLLPVADVVDTPHRAFVMPRGEPIKLPFINQNCRIRVRVVDFWPPQLEDFSKPITEYTEQGTQAESEEYSMGSNSPPSWEWMFVLLVEDAGTPPPGQNPARMSLIVSGKDGDYLLKLTATDLRKDARTLHELEEKLFILWGELLELKKLGKLDKRPSNMPFECCIREYGVKSEDGWMRLHKMFETTIK